MPDNNQQNNNTALANLFASLDDEQTPIRRIPLTNQQSSSSSMSKDKRDSINL